MRAATSGTTAPAVHRPAPVLPATRSARIPADISAALTPSQLDRLGQALAPRPADHAVAYQVSTSLLGRRYYLALFAGAEQRSPERLDAEGTVRPLVLVVMQCGLVLSAVAGVAAPVLVGTAVSVYLAKSYLGIDLLDGPSFMHHWFFD